MEESDVTWKGESEVNAEVLVFISSFAVCWRFKESIQRATEASENKILRTFVHEKNSWVLFSEMHGALIDIAASEWTVTWRDSL
jgi:hypothetical protein